MRALMGIAVLCIVIPAMALVMPEQFERLTSWGEDPEVAFDDPQAIAAARDRRAPAKGRSVSSSPNAKGQATAEAARNKNAADSSETSTTISSEDTSTTSAPPTTGDTSGSPTSTSGTPSTTSGAIRVDGEISGDACPCEVTGTVELKGTINLKGDLMVMGGTLVARPGVTVNGNGFQIMFMNGGRADFQGTEVFTWSGDGTNQNLSRDVNFNNLRRIMFHSGAGPSVIRYVSVKNSGNNSVLGDYPLHWHMNGSSVSGTLVEGVVVVGGKNHAFVPHGSHGITFKDVIAKDTLEDAFWWDPPVGKEDGVGSTNRRFHTANNSNNITITHALVDGVDSTRKFKYRLAGFVLGAGANNKVTDSVARNIASGKQCSGFHWTEKANANSGGNVWGFANNRSINPSGCKGIFVWQNDGSVHLISNFTSNTGIEHGAYVNRYVYRNVNVPSLVGHALGWSVENSSVGQMVIVGHSLEGDPITFTGVDFDSLTIDNASGVSSPKAGTYILTNTNLSCSDIVIKSKVPGTRIIVDGEDC